MLTGLECVQGGVSQRVRETSEPCTSAAQLLITIPFAFMCVGWMFEQTFKSANVLDAVLGAVHIGAVLGLNVWIVVAVKPFRALEWRIQGRCCVAHVATNGQGLRNGRGEQNN